MCAYSCILVPVLSKFTCIFQFLPVLFKFFFVPLSPFFSFLGEEQIEEMTSINQ